MRGKLIIPNFAIVLLLGLGSFLFLRVSLETEAKDALKRRMELVSTLFVRSEALHGYELLHSVRKEALSKRMVQAFSPVAVPPEEGLSEKDMDEKVRQAWFSQAGTAIRRYAAEWKKERRERPDLILLTDRVGVVISRNVTPNACPTGYNVAESVGIVEKALDGEAAYAVWSVDDSPYSSTVPDKKHCQLMNAGLMELAAAPVWFGDDIAGVLVIGFEISNGTAQRNAAMLGVDVAVLRGNDVYSSSFLTETARQSLENQLDTPSVKTRVGKVASSGVKSEVFEILVEGVPYLAMSLPVSQASDKDRVTTMIMGSQEKAVSNLRSLSLVLVFMGGALLAVFIVGMVLSNHFMRPIMAIEEGILRVINGEYDYRFDVKSSEVGGLSYRINQLIGALTGDDDDTEEE